MDLDQPCTQKVFADLVGVGQPVVSELLTRGVLKARDSMRIWLIAYTAHLREQAAGRGGDGALAANRAAESATRNELLQIKLKRRAENTRRSMPSSRCSHLLVLAWPASSSRYRRGSRCCVPS